MNNILKAENLKEDLKEKAVVRICVFPDEVEPETMPKPRHVCVSKFENRKWVTRKVKTGNKVSDGMSSDLMSFAIMNSKRFVVVDNDQEVIDQTVNMLESVI